MRLKNAIDWFVPAELKSDIVSYSKAKITISVMFIIALLLLPNAFRGIKIGQPSLALAAIAASFLMALGPFVLKKSRSQLIAGNYFLCVYTPLITYVTIIRGGATSYYADNYLQIILIAFLITNLLTGIVWSVICFTSLFSMKTIETMGVQFNAISLDTAATNILVMVVVVAVLSIVYEWNSNKNLKLFAKERDQSEKAAESLQKILDETSEVMTGVAEGDLSNRISSDIKGSLGKLKSSVNNALMLLGDSIEQVLSTSHEINRGTTEISAAAQDLANGSTEQAASIEEISSSMHEISAKAITNDENATHAQLLSNQAVVDLEKGSLQMNTMLAAMNTISENSINVSKVIKVIDEIAFQTNLLALNAAVEAARAGKYGKGFAVVAEEVRNLAARSSEAAKDTTQLIETSIKNVENGVESAQEMAETLKGFVGTINKVNDIVGEISVASKEQTTSVAEINDGLHQVNEVVQRNSSISEESASASEELSSQAEILQNLMNQFKLESTNMTHKQVPGRSKSTSTPIIPPVTHPLGNNGRKQIVLNDADFGSIS